MQNKSKFVKNLQPLLLLLALSAYLFYVLLSCTNQEKEEEQAINEIENVVLTDADYVGTETCRSCHQEAYDDWHESHHDLAMMKPDKYSVKGDFNDVSFTSQGVTSRFFKRGDDYWVNTEGPDSAYHDYKIIYTFGIEPLQQYIVEFPNGNLQCLRTAWDTEENKWFDLYPDFPIDPLEWLHWSRGGLNWNTMCSDCHSTNVHKNYNEEMDGFETTYSIIDVSCEACHGPGKEHVDFVTDEDFDADKYYPAEQHMHLTSGIMPKEQVDQCARCHVRRTQITKAFNHQGDFLDHYVPEILRDNFYFPDGQIMDEDYVYGSFVQSKMYQLNVECTDCHNPHSLELKAIGNALCAQCHEPEQYDTPDHHFHPMNTESSECVNCHMTGRLYMVNDFRRDHSFRVPRPDLSIEYDNPNACNGCHTDKSAEWAAEAVDEWYGPERDYHFSETLSLASTREPEAIPPLITLAADTSQPAIARATAVWYLSQMATEEAQQAILRSIKANHPLIRHTAANALLALPMQQKVQYLVPLLQDEFRSVRVAAMSALAEVDKKNLPPNLHPIYDKVMAEYRESLDTRADFPGGQFEKGQFFDRTGEAHLAEKHYLRAIEEDNLFNPARLNLAHLYNRQEQNDKAINLFKTIINFEPDYGPAYYSLGLLYAEEQKMGMAIDYLSQAAELEQNPRVYYNLGLAHQQVNQPEEAEDAYLKGLELNEQNPDIMNALAILYIQQEQFAKAKPYAEALNEMFPNNPQLQQMLQMIQQGNTQ